MTRVSKVTIDRHEFYLAPGASASILSAEIADLVRAGGGMVSLPVRTGRTITALVSPGIGIFVEEFDTADEPESGDDAEFSSSGFDYDDYEGR